MSCGRIQAVRRRPGAVQQPFYEEFLARGRPQDVPVVRNSRLEDLPRLPGLIGITGPCASTGTAPQASQVGVGGITPHQTVGTDTQPPQILHVPIALFIVTTPP